jgi:hypothetical protein
MTCDEFASKLADHLEGELPGAARIAMDAHAAMCEECSRLLSEIETLRGEASTLPLLEPSRDLWAGIAERIDARVLPLEATRGGRGAPARRTWMRSSVAAAALVLVTAGITHLWTRLSYEQPAAIPAAGRQVATAPAGVVEPDSGMDSTTRGTSDVNSSGRPDALTPTRSATTRVSGAARTPADRGGRSGIVLVRRPTSAEPLMNETQPIYDREILKLRRIVRERRSQLDPRTVAVLEQSIAVIDSAIAQSRAALANDPASGFLATQLNHSLEKKVELLRTAALLPART